MTENQHRPGSFCTSVLHTRDLVRATAFYERLFGWHALELPGARGVVRLAIDGRAMAHARLRDGRHDAWVPHVLVEDIDTTATLAVAEGASVLEADGPCRSGARRHVDRSRGRVVRPLAARTRHRRRASRHARQPVVDRAAVQRRGRGDAILRTRVRVAVAPHRVRALRPLHRVRARRPAGRRSAADRRGLGRVAVLEHDPVSVGNADEAGRLATALGGCVHFVHTVPTAGRIAVLADPGGAVFVVRPYRRRGPTSTRSPSARCR